MVHSPNSKEREGLSLSLVVLTTLSLSSPTESSPVVPKTVNKRPFGEIFFTVLGQPDEHPLKTPFLP